MVLGGNDCDVLRNHSGLVVTIMFPEDDVSLELTRHDIDYLEICWCYKSIYEAPSVKGGSAKWIHSFFSVGSCLLVFDILVMLKVTTVMRQGGFYVEELKDLPLDPTGQIDKFQEFVE